MRVSGGREEGGKILLVAKVTCLCHFRQRMKSFCYFHHEKRIMFAAASFEESYTLSKGINSGLAASFRET